jgi:undecaprenyl-diphosphatase
MRVDSLDLAVMVFVAAHRGDWATSIASGVMWVGTTPAVLATVALLVAVALIAFRAWRPAAAAGTALIAAAVAAAGFKSVIERPRPPAELALVATGGFSFPSTQAAETAALAVAFLLTQPWRNRALGRTVAGGLAAAVALVGVCMVYLGPHWPTDVLAGWVLGAALGTAAASAVRAGGRATERRPESDDAPLGTGGSGAR